MDIARATGSLELLRPLSATPDGEEVYLARAQIEGVERLVAALHVEVQTGSRRDVLLRTATEYALQLRHEHLAPLLGIEASATGLWLLSEPADGPTLHQVIADKRASGGELSALTAVQLVRPIASALHHGHAEAADVDGERLHIPHGRLTPWTVFIGRGGRVKVSDYWLGWVRARLAGRELTGWSSPSIAQHNPPTAQDDLFAVGAILFELLTLTPLLWPEDLARTREALTSGAWLERLWALEAAGIPPG